MLQSKNFISKTAAVFIAAVFVFKEEQPSRTHELCLMCLRFLQQSTMLDNPDVLLSLVGITGLIAVGSTALLNRDTTQKIISSIGEKIDRTEVAISYVKGKIDSLENILSDGVISPSEVDQIQQGAAEIKDKITSIINPGGDAA